MSPTKLNTFNTEESNKSVKDKGSHRLRATRAFGFFAIVAALAAPASAQQITLSLDSATTTSGGTATLTLSDTYSGSARAAGLEWTLSYPAADIASIDPSTNPADTALGKTVACNSSNGTTICVLAGLNSTSITAGEIAAISVHVSPTAPDSTVPIQVSKVVAVAADGSGLSTSATGGSISISGSATTSLSGLSCSPGSVTSQASSSCTVSLSGTAPASTVTVGLSSNNTSVTVPAHVTIAAGKTSATFSAKVGSVSSSQTATLTASWAGQTRTFALKISPASSNSAPIANGVYRIYNAYSTYGLDDPAFSVSSGTQIVQWPLNGGQNQQWKFTSNTSGQYTIQNVFSGLYLTDVNGILQQVLQNNKTSQLWTLKVVNSTLGYTLTNVSTRRLITDPNYSKSSGIGITTAAPDNGRDQFWPIK